MLKILLIFFFSLTSYATEKTISDCSELKSDCEYYLCMETHKSCGRSGYLQSFGHKYCHRFEEYTSHQLSSKGQEWITNVRSCLIEKISELDPNLSCQQLKKEAFKSHIPCYLENKFCELPIKDKLKIIRAIGRGLRKPSVISAGIRVMRSCRLIRWY